jgi:hypothetical protein
MVIVALVIRTETTGDIIRARRPRRGHPDAGARRRRATAWFGMVAAGGVRTLSTAAHDAVRQSPQPAGKGV